MIAKDNSLKQDRRDYSRQQQEEQSQRQRMQHDIQQLQQQIRRIEQDIHGLENSGQNKAAMYNSKFPLLLQQIEAKKQSGQLRGEVFGPIGMHVQMREGYEEWGQALERALGPNVFNFVVSKYTDRPILDKLMRECGCITPIVIQSSTQRYQVQSHAPSHVVAMLDAIHIPEDVIFNCLVDQANIERTYFVNEESEITRNHIENVNGLDRLKYNASAFITKSATTVKYASGNQSSEVSSYPYRGFLAKDLTSYVENSKREREEKLHELQVLQQQYQQAGQGNAYTSMIAKIDTELQQISSQMRNKNREKKHLDDQMSELENAKQIDTSNLESEAEELKQEIANLTQQEEEKASSLSVLQVEATQYKQAEREIEIEKQKIQKQLQTLMGQLEQLSHDVETAKRTVDKLRRQVDVTKADVHKAESVVEKVNHDLVQSQQHAAEETQKLVPDWDGNPLPLGRKETKEALDRKAMELRAELTQGKRQAGLQGFTLEIAKERNDKAQATVASMIMIFETIQSSYEQLKHDIKERKERWVDTLKGTTKKVRLKFDEYVQEKGATGTVVFDHQAKTLELKVQIDAEDTNTLANDVRNLSGGERSYVTFSLLQALGHVVRYTFPLTYK